MTNNIGALIAKLRKEKGLTQLELANKLNVTDKAVSKWECESAFPSIDLLPKIAELLGVNTEELIDGDIKPKNENTKEVLEINQENYINELDVYASGQFKVELTKSKKVSSTNRVPVKASVNKGTGEVKFYIDKDLINRLT